MNWKQCIWTDERGRKHIKVAPNCSEASQGVTLSIQWEDYLEDLDDEQLDTVYAITFGAGLRQTADAGKSGVYDIMYSALKRAGMKPEEARKIGTMTIQKLRSNEDG